MSAADVLDARRSRCRGWSSWRTPPAFRRTPSAPLLASGIDFVLEGLYATKKISRSEERGYHGSRPGAVRGRRASRSR